MDSRHRKVNSDQTEVFELLVPRGPACHLKREQMTNPMTDLDAYTDEEFEQKLARVLAHARGEVLNDAEVQRFSQLNEQILRRRAASGNAA